ncbi:type IV inositol polyphosphate 5-phosphatase 11 isoform X2 [Cajanus cajan]|uniref:type IV inositol polyphosphate 5-phosphatase 11 isoform X2 n=1 Tax=Cajanus cajan TaxID=3821 RepID=UPI0010FB2BE4|nr:type IV inositol polyphosphate 5-phosphatase 11 isoform X2 [Cajanus cajan]
MGNQLCKGRRYSSSKRRTMGFIHNQASPSHIGIRNVGVDKICNFSTTNSDLCISIVTWNMNGQVTFEDLAEMVGSNREFDLLAVGLQEAPPCPRNKVATMLSAALDESHTCTCLDQRMQDRSLMVDKESVGGCGGIIGRKKGAVAIRINYKGIRMVFISCHLSAHGRNVEERNSQCRHISHSLFSKFWNPYSRPSHITIWLGDLNYRLQGIDTYPARTLIEKNLHRRLHSKDQLLQEAGRGQIFNGFCEGTLTFKPTYKYNKGSSNYDTSHKIRVPAWTDRILFKIEDDNNMEATLHSYESMDEIYGSDHKPVKAHLCLRLRQIPTKPSCNEQT